jgi:CheY-like chemotaxis protein
VTAGEHAILVVDDNDDSREVIARQLEHAGFRVEQASSGPEALARVAAAPPSLVLLDVNMPRMTGLEVLGRLREAHTPVQLPVIMITARSGSDDVVESLGLGANDHVTKPFDLKVVVARVEAALRMRTPARADPASADEARTPAEVHPGMTLAGRYALETRIGSGTFGTVFRARHAELGHPVAVKVLQASAIANPEALARFRREGITACRVRHPNAVQVLDFGVTGGIAYLVMELLSGYSLEKELEDGGKVPLARTVKLMVPVCDALAAAHRSGIVHRDVKPANVFLHLAGGEEHPKVLDFGIARIVGEAAADPRVTLDGFVVGTPAYMAPERFRNQAVDGRTDVYSVGVTLYQMLAGRLPFAADPRDPMAVAMQHLEAEPPPMEEPELPPAVEEVVRNAMRKAREHRPDAARLGQDLLRAAGGRRRRASDRPKRQK